MPPGEGVQSGAQQHILGAVLRQAGHGDVFCEARSDWENRADCGGQRGRQAWTCGCDTGEQGFREQFAGDGIVEDPWRRILLAVRRSCQRGAHGRATCGTSLHVSERTEHPRRLDALEQLPVATAKLRRKRRSRAM